ncbi:MAG TPA: hypothetical protein VJS14_17325 [Enterobacteriaceae bacterium]|nr:hypothetical protein [Enterobacteriaceae bacterium]
MKLKNKKITISLLVALIIAALATLWIVTLQKKKQHLFGSDCSATLSMSDKSARFAAKLNIYLNMRGDGTGYLDMTGTTNSGEVDERAARSYSFDYALQSGNTLHLTNIVLDKRAADTANDGLVDKLIFSIDSRTGRYVKIATFNNVWTIGNLYSPLFVCVINES